VNGKPQLLFVGNMTVELILAKALRFDHIQRRKGQLPDVLAEQFGKRLSP
jgi:hypothetical protein